MGYNTLWMTFVKLLKTVSWNRLKHWCSMLLDVNLLIPLISLSETVADHAPPPFCCKNIWTNSKHISCSGLLFCILAPTLHQSLFPFLLIYNKSWYLHIAPLHCDFLSTRTSLWLNDYSCWICFCVVCLTLCGISWLFHLVCVHF